MIPMYPDFYNEVFGPVMQPFSSFHTAGPCRMGFLTYCLLEEEPASVVIQLAPGGTFEATFGLHNEDMALLSGATGHLPDDKILFSMREYCKENDIHYSFLFENIEETDHHTAAKITLTGRSGKKVCAVSASIGGGVVETLFLNGYSFKSDGTTYVLLVFDESDEWNYDQLRDKISSEIDILEGGKSVKTGKGTMYWFKSGNDPIKARCSLKSMETAVLKPITAVTDNRSRRPQLFDTMVKWRELAAQQNKTLAEISIEYEMASSGWSRKEVVSYMEDVLAVKMQRAVTALYTEEIPSPPPSPFSEKQYEKWDDFVKKGPVFSGEIIGRALHYANAASVGLPGVEFVPGPMGTGGGLIFSTLLAAKEAFGYTKEDLVRALFIAAGVGAVAFTHTVPGGANVGCMGEMGICGAMASAALTEMAGGTPEQVEAAASMFLMTSMGWPCDPVPGAKSMPCGNRAYTVVAMSLVYSDIARSGKDYVFPFHEVLKAADEVGRLVNSGSSGCEGHRSCPSAKNCMSAFNQWHSAKTPEMNG